MSARTIESPTAVQIEIAPKIKEAIEKIGLKPKPKYTNAQLNKMPLWQLLEIAIADLRAVEVDPLYRIDMDEWHEYDTEYKVCNVCLAGAVLAKSRLRSPKRTVGSCPEWMYAINCLRMGEVNAALRQLGRRDRYDASIGPLDREIADFGGMTFWEDVEKLQADLKAAGV